MAKAFSTRQVCGKIFLILGRHLGPLLLALVLAGAPLLASEALNALSTHYTMREQAVRDELYTMRDGALAGTLTPEQHDRFMELWVKESHWAAAASEMDMYSTLLALLAFFVTPPLMMGVGRELMAMMRGLEHRWRSAWLPGGAFRRGFAVQCWLFVMALFCAIPGLLVAWGGQAIFHDGSLPHRIVQLCGMVLAIFLSGGMLLRSVLALPMAADDQPGTASELADRSASVLDRKALWPLIQLLLPHLLAYAARYAVMRLPLPVWAAAAAATALAAFAWLYLLVAVPAVYVTFFRDPRRS